MSDKCPHCGTPYPGKDHVALEHIRHVPLCPVLKKQSEAPVSGYEYLKRPDGTFLVGFKGGNIHQNHWHVAPDATVLSVVENGDHRFKRTDVTRKINNVCPDLNISFLWNG